MNTLLNFGWGIGWLLALFLTWAAPQAFAHSYLIQTVPPLGSSLEAAPPAFEFEFTEPVDRGFSAFVLQDRGGQVRVELPFALADDGRRAKVDLTGQTFSNGVYRIAWRALSTVDGHTTHGVIPFGVGTQVALAELEGGGQDAPETPALGRVVARWLVFISLTLLAGAALFGVLFSEAAAWPRAWLVGLVGVLLGAGVLDMVYQGQDVGAPWWAVAIQSRWGLFHLVKTVFAVGVGALLWNRKRNIWSHWGSAALAGLMLLSAALASHNANLGPAGVLADWTHLAAASAWFAGLVHLVALVPRALRQPGPDQPARVVAVVVGFSRLALVSVVALLVTGLYAAFQHVPSWAALWGTFYGRALAAKAALMVPLLGLAAVNRFWLVPRLRSVAQALEPLRSLRRTVGFEALGVAAVLFFAAALTNASPPHAHVSPVETPKPLTTTGQTEGVVVQLTADPVQEGQRTLSVRATTSQGTAVEGVLRLTLEFVYVGEDLGDTFFRAVAEPLGDGRYLVRGPFLLLPGLWTVTAELRLRGRAEDVRVGFSLRVSADGGVTAVDEPQQGPDDGS